MKKRIITLTMPLVFLSSACFAASANDNVNQKVLAIFTEKFTSAKQVTWNKTDKYVKASFILNDQHLFAYFDQAGDLLGLSKNITSNHLPINLKNAFKEYLGAGWVTELFEFAGKDETTYFATVENGEQIVMIKSSGNNSWAVYKKTKKK